MRIRERLILALGGSLRPESVTSVPTIGLQESKKLLASCIHGLRLIDGLLSGGQIVAAHKQVRVLYTAVSGQIAAPRKQVADVT